MTETQGLLPKILTAEEVATCLRVAPATVYRLAGAGEIPAIKVGRVWRFSSRLLDEWLSEQMWGNLASEKRSGGEERH